MEKIREYYRKYHTVLHELFYAYDIEMDHMGNIAPLSVTDSIDESVLNYLDLTTSSYGVDYRGNKSLVKLFDTGDEEYFPAFWVGNDIDYEHNIDSYPIYVIDLSDNIAFGTSGNFRMYMENIINYALTLEPHNKELNEILYMAKHDLYKFSIHCINKSLYNVKYVDKKKLQLTTNTLNL